MTLDRSEPSAAPALSGPADSDASGAHLADSARAAMPSAPPAEEVELWWGAFSGRTLLPSFLVCLLLTGLIGWAGWYFVPREWTRTVVVGASGLVWLVQIARWIGGTLRANYRLTTHRLWVVRGVRLMKSTAIELTQVRDVTVTHTWLEQRLDVGRIVLAIETSGLLVVLRGIRQPHKAAEVIRAAVRAARHPVGER